MMAKRSLFSRVGLHQLPAGGKIELFGGRTFQPKQDCIMCPEVIHKLSMIWMGGIESISSMWH